MAEIERLRQDARRNVPPRRCGTSRWTPPFNCGPRWRGSRGVTRWRPKYGVDDAPPYFDAIDIQLQIDSPAGAEQVSALVANAERACHATQSLRHGVAV